MYAIIEVKGKQYKVEQGQEVDVDLIKELNAENTLSDYKVLLLADNDNVKIGQPYLDNVNIVLKKVQDLKGEKIIGFKYKRRKNYHKKYGHRQQYTRLVVESIAVS